MPSLEKSEILPEHLCGQSARKRKKRRDPGGPRDRGKPMNRTLSENLSRLTTWYSESFGRHPAKSLAFFTIVSSFLWTVQTALCQKILPLDVIEAVVWGEELQWGQMKSPPLSGWLAALFSRLSGHSDWSLYLLSQLTIVCAVFFVYKLAREFFDECGAATAAMLLYFLYYYMPPAMKFCSHSTQTALLPAVGYFFWKGVKDDRLRDWLLLALFAALATLGKYAAIQVLAGCFVFMILHPPARKRFASPGPYLAGILYLLLLLPHILWLCDHDFLPVKHLGERLAGAEKGIGIALLSVLTVLMPYALLAAVLTVMNLPEKRPWHLFRRSDAAPQNDTGRRTALFFSLSLTLVPELFYLVPALSGESIILMWFSYLAGFTGITAVALLPEGVTHKVFRRLYAVLWLYFAILFVGVTLDVLNKPRYRIHSEPEVIVGMAERFYKERSGGRPIPVVYGDRWLAGVIQNYSPHRPPACVHDDVCNMELYRERLKREGGLVIFNGQTDYAGAFRAAGLTPVPLTTFKYTYASQFGKRRKDSLSFGFLAPSAAAPQRQK